MFDEQFQIEGFQPIAKDIMKCEGLGFIITSRAYNYDFVSRCFYPKLGVLEDPVTGRAHTYLTPIWINKIGRDELVAQQLSDREGLLEVTMDDERVYISGEARLFMIGDISLNL